MPPPPPGPVKISLFFIKKKMVAKGGHIDFMFLAPFTRPLDPLLNGSSMGGLAILKPRGLNQFVMQFLCDHSQSC